MAAAELKYSHKRARDRSLPWRARRPPTGRKRRGQSANRGPDRPCRPGRGAVGLAGESARRRVADLPLVQLYAGGRAGLKQRSCRDDRRRRSLVWDRQRSKPLRRRLAFLDRPPRSWERRVQRDLRGVGQAALGRDSLGRAARLGRGPNGNPGREWTRPYARCTTPRTGSGSARRRGLYVRNNGAAASVAGLNDAHVNVIQSAGKGAPIWVGTTQRPVAARGGGAGARSARRTACPAWR